ncbi:hypothetical protein, partial [Paenibacillus xylanexedens]|uniref:hypothetical protein n=1 Tax=Paenibacillus xylanexedens TaxID=528191 RepID=UPI001C930D0B
MRGNVMRCGIGKIVLGFVERREIESRIVDMESENKGIRMGVMIRWWVVMIVVVCEELMGDVVVIIGGNN